MTSLSRYEPRRQARGPTSWQFASRRVREWLDQPHVLRCTACMARPLRLEFARAVFHIMARGNQGQKIFADDHDREMWQATLAQAWNRTGWRIHAWALMANHYHLLLEPPNPTWSAA